jgi:hypothetical protein
VGQSSWFQKKNKFCRFLLNTRGMYTAADIVVDGIEARERPGQRVAVIEESLALRASRRMKYSPLPWNSRVPDLVTISMGAGHSPVFGLVIAHEHFHFAHRTHAEHGFGAGRAAQVRSITPSMEVLRPPCT